MALEPDSRDGKFGKTVRRLRRQAGLSQSMLGVPIRMRQGAVSDVERGKVQASEHQAKGMDEALGGGTELADLWRTLYEGWQPPSGYKRVSEMERRSSQILDYQALVITGLLQTERYARSTFRAGSRTSSSARVESQVSDRISRHSVLAEPDSPYLVAVIDEHVLHRRLGSADIMREQLEHLLTVSSRDRVEVAIVPTSTWNPPGVDGSFRLIRVPEAMVLYRETGATGDVIIKPEIVDEHVALMGDLRSVALPPDQSRSLIKSINGEYL